MLYTGFFYGHRSHIHVPVRVRARHCVTGVISCDARTSQATGLSYLGNSAAARRPCLVLRATLVSLSPVPAPAERSSLDPKVARCDNAVQDSPRPRGAPGRILGLSRLCVHTPLRRSRGMGLCKLFPMPGVQMGVRQAGLVVDLHRRVQLPRMRHVRQRGTVLHALLLSHSVLAVATNRLPRLPKRR